MMDLDALYAELPVLACQGRCQAICGPIMGTPAENARILRRHHRVLGPDPTGRACRLLTDGGQCAVYADRPMICRVWGLTPDMACPHGCTPDRWLTERQVSDYMQVVLRG